VKRPARPSSRAAPRRRAARPVTRAGGFDVRVLDEVAQLQQELERAGASRPSLRWNAEPEDVQRSVVQLVLTLVEFIRRLLERQAIRRMEAGSLTDEEVERIGRALMQLEATVVDLADRFDIDRDMLQLDLGPVGRLM
jgi:hypothetical protein